MVSTLIHFPPEPWCEITTFWTRLEEFEHGLDFILTDPINTQELGALFDGAHAMLHQSLQGFYAWWVLFLIILDCSLPLASNFMKYGAWLGCYFYLYHRQIKCQPQSWFITFPVIQQHLDSRLLHHLIISLWILPLEDWYSFSGFQTCIDEATHAFRHRAAYWSYQHCSCWYNCVSMGFWWLTDYSLRSAWITKILDILDSAVSKQVGNTLIF